MKVSAATIYNSIFFQLVQLKANGTGFVKCTESGYLGLLNNTALIRV